MIQGMPNEGMQAARSLEASAHGPYLLFSSSVATSTG
jgi:hypothetical protein